MRGHGLDYSSNIAADKNVRAPVVVPSYARLEPYGLKAFALALEAGLEFHVI